MPSLPPEDVLPVLVADLADDDARDVLEAAAARGGRVCLPLETAPVSASRHLLEVQVPGIEGPLSFLATPLGPPSADGFPLELEPLTRGSTSEPPSKAAPPPLPRRVMRSRRPSLPPESFTASHFADLDLAAPRLPSNAISEGRTLAGGKLSIEGLIGRGGVGTVYKARHRELKIPIAIKVLNESFQQDLDFCRRFYAEALAASRLDHPNITRVLDFGQEPSGQLYFAMEYLDGVELRAVLERERVLSTERIVQVMIQVCAGLAHAHARGIIHRDIKPENLILIAGQDDDGRRIDVVKVCDFGIAQHRARATSIDEDGLVAGTPEYMSPEHCRGDELDPRSDLYACGVVLYEMTTGQVPFLGGESHEVLAKHLATPVLPPSKIRADVDLRLERVIMKALAKRPDDRYSDMRALRAALRELTADADLSPPSVRSSPTRAAAPVRGPTWLERGPVYAQGPVRGSFAAPALDVAGPISRDPVAFLRDLVQVTDERVFSQRAQLLEPALRSLAASGDVRTLWTVATTLQAMTMQGTRRAGSRADAAARSLRVFQDPSVLALVASELLLGSEHVRADAKRILVQAGVAGAYGLYAARVKLAHHQAVRGPFLATLKELGPKAWPVVRAALEKMLKGESNAATIELAEDLLLATASIGDEQAGHVVVKYLRSDVSSVCRAATAAIVKLWGDRSKALLVGMLQSKVDVVRIAGIAGLRQIRAIDEHVVPRLSAILMKRLPAGDELRAAAAVALAYASPNARKPALSLLEQLVTPPPGAAARPAPASASLSGEDAVMIALARSLLTLGGSTCRRAVTERAERSPSALRAELLRLLR